MPRFRSTLLCLTVLAFACLEARGQNVDSLLARLDESTGLQRVEILASLAEAVQRSDPRASIRYSNEALSVKGDDGSAALEEEIRYWKGRAHFSVAEFDSAVAQANLIRASATSRNDRGGIARAANLHATAMALQGRFNDAIPLFQEALKEWRDLEDLEGTANALNNLGIAHMRLGNYDTSLDFYLQALEVWDALGDEEGRIRTLNNAGNVHSELGNIEEAKSYYEEVLRYREATDDRRGEAIVLNNLGLIYHAEKQLELAVETFMRGEEIARQLGDRFNEARLLGNLGKVYADMGVFDRALSAENRALAIRREIGDRRGQGITQEAIARIYMQAGRDDDALVHLDSALAAATEVADLKLMRDIYERQSEIHAAQGNYLAALEAHRLFKSSHDSLFTEESQNTIAELRTRYETEQREREIESLVHEREISRLWRNVLLVGIAMLLLIVFLLFSRYRFRTRAHRELESAHQDLEEAHQSLKKAQVQLIQAEKAASLGRLTAGIAHEIKNPLNFVNNFAALSVDLARDLKDELASETPNMDEVDELVNEITGNAERIAVQGKRADGIVASMMLHASGKVGEREPIDLNDLVSDYIVIAYHGVKATSPSFDCSIEKSFDENLPKVDGDPQELGRVFVNVLYNAFDAVMEVAQSGADGYEPLLRVSTGIADGMIEVRIWDNGIGLPEGAESQIFDPFFTTKPTGTGTGLGLSLSHDIVVGRHGGQIIAAKEDGGTAFRIRLPLP